MEHTTSLLQVVQADLAASEARRRAQTTDEADSDAADSDAASERSDEDASAPRVKAPWRRGKQRAFFSEVKRT